MSDVKKGTTELGDVVEDRITGFSGIVYARAEYMYGCLQVCVKPTTVKDDGKPLLEGVWIDEPQLIVLDRPGVVGLRDDDNDHIRSNPTGGGGPRETPPERAGGPQ